MWRESGARALYVFVAVASLVFSSLLVSALLVERSGPSQGRQGVVTEASSGTKTVRTCRPSASSQNHWRRDCSDRTIGAFTVIGEREDGTPWVVVGEDAFRSTSVGATVEVETSSITGRVVGLRGLQDWHVSESSSSLVLALAFMGFAISFVGLGEVNRRRGVSAIAGRLGRPELLAGLLAVPIAFAGVWFALFNETRGLGLVSTEEQTGGFLAAGAPGQERLSSNTIGGTLFTTVPLSAVAEDRQPDPGPELVAVPIIADRSGARVSTGRLNWAVQIDDAVLEPVACPPDVVAFPSGEAPGLATGFLCFAAFTGRGVLVGAHEVGPVGGAVVAGRYEFTIDPAGG